MQNNFQKSPYMNQNPPRWIDIKEISDKYFFISKRNSTISREIFGGISTFLAMSYIFIVNPNILSQAGFNHSTVLFATIITSSFATILMGVWARLPFAVAPGMEMNAYVAFFAIGALGFDWRQALGLVFWSSVIMIILTISKIRENIIDSIPETMKTGLAFSVGVFIILVALNISGVLVYEGISLKGFGTILDERVYVLVAGLIIILLFNAVKIPGAALFSILIMAAVWNYTVGSPSENFGSILDAHVFEDFGATDISVILNPQSISVVLVLFVLDFYGSVAKFIGLTQRTTILENGKLPGRTQALLVDGGCSLMGAGLGTTSVITYVESAVGINMGARTGLAAVTCGVLMLMCFLAAPFLHYIPLAATTGTLVYVGITLCPPIAEIRRMALRDKVVLIAMPVCVLATFAIDRAMLLGFLIYLSTDILSKRRPNPFLLGSTVLLLVGFILQVI